MRQYIDFALLCADETQAEIATAYLSDLPFESFDSECSEQGVVLHAYMPLEQWEDNRLAATDAVEGCGKIIGQHIIEDENWNATWEQESFSRVDIDQRMVIRAPHHPAPDDPAVKDIVVVPRMSFGSGHHYTSRMMCRAIMRLTPPEGHILDVGCGTGILSLAALKCGAASAVAVDIDPWSVESASEAAHLNGVAERMRVVLGTVESVPGELFDMVVANINRNIILQDMAHYAAALKAGGVLLLSGFLREDIEAISQAAERYDIHTEQTTEDNEWICLECRKQL